MPEQGSPRLLEKLRSFEFDEPAAALPFTSRLARENGWTHGYAARVVREYKHFLYLAVAAGHPVTPSEEVDQAWHLHLLYTRSYWLGLCRGILGRDLHHVPTSGGGSEDLKFRDWYAQTLQSYAELLGESPPADIWPAVDKRFAQPGRWRWVDTTRAWIVMRPSSLRFPSLRNAARPPS